MSPNDAPIRVLLVEDQDADAELTTLALTSQGLDCRIERVQDERAFLAALERLPDLILSDHQLPAFSGGRALELLNERGLDIPYIAVSGELSSFDAVQLLRNGARDWIPKHDLTRLGPAVRRELREARERRVHRRERRLLDQLRLAVESSQDSIAVLDRDLRFLYANAAHLRRHARDEAGLIGRSLREVLSERNFLSAQPHLERALAGETVHFFSEQDFAGAGRLHVSVTYSPLRNAAGDISGVVGVLRDVSEQKRAELARDAHLRHIQTLLEAMPVACIALDTECITTDINPAFERLFGFPRAALVGHSPFVTMIPPERHAMLREVFARVLAGERVDVGLQTNRHADGSEIQVQWTNVPVHGTDGAVTGILAIALDLTERERVAAELKQSHDRLKTVTRATNDVVWDWDPATDTLVWNENLALLFGHAAERLSTDLAYWVERVHPEDREHICAGFHAALDGDAVHWQGEYRFRHQDGNYTHVFDRALIERDATGKVLRAVGAMQDISARKAAEERLERLATHDTLTGLLNRNALDDVVSAARGATPETGATLVVVNLDRFKEINDTLGHGVGDAALVRAAALLGSLVPATGSVLRLGGDEFAVVLPGDEPAAAETLAERIVDALADPLLADDHEVFVTASIGIALAPRHGTDAEQLLRNADLAMYRVKREQCGGYLFYDPRFTARLRNRRQLESDLHRAVERGELALRFQPLLDLSDGRVVGAEALTRWTHPTLGDIAPARFIPVAEETGLIVPIGEWVLREACAAAVTWQRPGAPGVRVAVNVSAHQLRRGGFADLVAAVLRDTGLEPGLLELELTETTLMQDTAVSIAVLTDLKRLGVSLAMDDFGTGYSSLAYLHRFPMDKLKIDRSFIAGLPHDAESVALASTIMAMAHGLGMSALAEGIETRDQMRFLRDLGCEEGQGWHFARALSAGDFVGFLAGGDRPVRTRTRALSAPPPA